MIKKCIGCGAILQNEENNKIGYVPDFNKDYCMRCFKLKNYGQNILKPDQIDNEVILNRINKMNAFNVFLVDFLSINETIINQYKKIHAPKILTITKKDLLPKNILADKFIKKVKDIYNIQEPIFFISVKEDLTYFYHYLMNNKNNVVCGYTSAGKSSLINKIMGSNIVESKVESTTIDFIKIENSDLAIYDSPGFVLENSFPVHEVKTRIKQNIKNIKGSEEICINEMIFKSNIDNNIIFYLSNDLKIIKRKSNTIFKHRINIFQNSDLVIKGIGFMNIKNNCILETNIDLSLIEVRASLVGVDHE